LNAMIAGVTAGAPTGACPSQTVRFDTANIFKGDGTVEFLSNTRSLSGSVLGAISAAKSANRPPEPDLAPEPARRRFDLTDGQRVDKHGVPLDADGVALPIKTFKANRIPERSDTFVEA